MQATFFLPGSAEGRAFCKSVPEAISAWRTAWRGGKMDVKKFNITDDEQFALDLLHEKKILITRGGGFNWAEPDHFRIVYLPRMEVLKESLEDLADFFDHYRQS